MIQQLNFPTVHAPLAHWAKTRPNVVAIDDGVQVMTFAEAADAVNARKRLLSAQRAPMTVWIDDSLAVPARLIEFLAIVASGRRAAVADPEWPEAVRLQMRALIDQRPADAPAPEPATPFYVGFTSGSTGLPKGFYRDHRSWTESFRVCVAEFGEGAATRLLAPGRPSHSLFLFGMLLGLWSGAGVVVQTRFSALRTLNTLVEGQAPCLVAVPSQLLLLLETAKRRALGPAADVAQVMISGARWMRDRTPDLRALFPNARIVEFYGASETSFIAWSDADESLPAEVVGRPFANVEIDIRNAAHAGEPGLIYVRSPMVFLGYVGHDQDTTAALHDGSWLSVRDIGYLDAAGRLCLKGRQKRMIVTQGKNLFPEELESVLASHPAIAAVSVQGVADPLRGMQVVALVSLADLACTATMLGRWCRDRLESFKAPRRYFVCDPWPLTASGKTDHAALGKMLAASHDERRACAKRGDAGLSTDQGATCLIPLL